MKHRIVEALPRILVGIHQKMSLSQNSTHDLWMSFMMKRAQIQNRANTGFFDIKVYDPTLRMADFNKETVFTKWAAVEVKHVEKIPDEMEVYKLSGGKYAVFVHRGSQITFPSTLKYIFESWLPGSGFELDSRAHFEIMGENYKINDPASEEEVWIPIRETPYKK